MSGLFKFPKYEQHPLAISLMPGGMDPEEFEAFCEDIEARGVIMPVTLYEGKVLDGWHRYRAAEKTQCAFQTIKYEGKDPAGYIASVNVLRRKLSSLQRCLVGARLHLDHNLTQRQVCKKLGISNQVLSFVLKAIEGKNTKLIKRIETDGDFTKGMLREELEDTGLLRAKKEEPADPQGPNSVFALGSSISDAAARSGLPGDTEGSGGEEGEEHLPAEGKGLKSAQRAAHKSTKTPAYLLSEGFKALMADEKVTFLQMIWPEAQVLAKEAGLTMAPAKPSGEQSIDELLAGAAADGQQKPTKAPRKPAKAAKAAA